MPRGSRDGFRLIRLIRFIACLLTFIPSEPSVETLAKLLTVTADDNDEQ